MTGPLDGAGGATQVEIQEELPGELVTALARLRLGGSLDGAGGAT